MGARELAHISLTDSPAGVGACFIPQRAAGSPNRSGDTAGPPRGEPPPFFEDRGQGTYPPLPPVLALPLHMVSPMRTPYIGYRRCTIPFGRKSRAGLSHSIQTEPRIDGGYTSRARPYYRTRVLVCTGWRRGLCRPGGKLSSKEVFKVPMVGSVCGVRSIAPSYVGLDLIRIMVGWNHGASTTIA
jgi:hypothetical protein